tara:strand:- start:152 stop:661 length:510 start_codon:yes stop_codon:yes gene_type:complete
MFLYSCEKTSSNKVAVLEQSSQTSQIVEPQRVIEIEDFYKKDENLRNKITLPPILNDVRKMGIGFDFIYGHWIYNQDLFYNEMKRLDEPKIDMSLYFNKVEMIFYNDGSFISYLDDQVTRGEWEIDDEHLSLKPDNQAMISYDYTINDSALYIYDRDYILAFSKRIISE